MPGEPPPFRRTWMIRHPAGTRAAAPPRYPVLPPSVRDPAPERAVLPVEEDGIDGTRGALLELEPVAHLAQVAAHPGRRVGPQGEPAGFRLVVTERVPHLVARDVRRLDRLLHGHPELDHVEKALQQVLVLRVAPLHRGGQERLPVL